MIYDMLSYKNPICLISNFPYFVLQGCLSVSRGIIIAVILAAAAFTLLSLFAAYAGYATLAQIIKGPIAIL